MVIGTAVIGQLVVDMFKQVFIELVGTVTWRPDFVNYHFENISRFFDFI
jgi:hypothetical protein